MNTTTGHECELDVADGKTQLPFSRKNPGENGSPNLMSLEQTFNAGTDSGNLSPVVGELRPGVLEGRSPGNRIALPV